MTARVMTVIDGRHTSGNKQGTSEIPSLFSQDCERSVEVGVPRHRLSMLTLGQSWNWDRRSPCLIATSRTIMSWEVGGKGSKPLSRFYHMPEDTLAWKEMRECQQE